MMNFVETKGKYCTFFGTEVCEVTLLKQIDERFEQEGADALILGQGPVLSLGYINPVTMDCLCPVRGAFAVSSSWMDKFGGLDEKLKSAAVAELASFIKEHSGRVYYANDIIVPFFEKTDSDITDAWLTSLLLDFKLGDPKLRSRVIKQLFSAIRYNSSIGNYSRSIFLKRLPILLKYFLLYCFRKRRVSPRSESMGYYDPGFTRGCAELHKMKPDRRPKVSVVIRTHSRPEVLRKTLQGLHHQCYDNMEIIVIEDGEPTAEQMIKNDFSDLPVHYFATGVHIGRAAAANTGFSMATGEYINLLDDDDFLYPGHIIAGITEAEATGADIIFLYGLGLETEVNSQEPYNFNVINSHLMNFPRIDEFTMSISCVTPDNGVLFNRNLLNKVGGMREELHAHEDWSLWLKMMTVALWEVVPYATSAFVNPASSEQIEQRNTAYREYRGLQFEDETLWYNESSEKLRGFLCGKINDGLALSANHQLDDQLMKDIEYWNIDVSDSSPERKAFEYFKSVCLENMEGLFSAKDFNTWFRGMCSWLYQFPPEKRQGALVQLRKEIE